ncbi:NAD(P)/FAD-dependent oxidoreductase [Acidocella sp.]|uniref:NAD(P)/FAD-dependent oxidoreductase n=1 Tax=Acidocella sp. TaxID=50710 RepID=UPI00262B6D5C|nr:FAD-dependent oxidoreductase [Acidocella sp.]
MLRDEVFDVAVIGGGVVGCAVMRRFAIAGAKVVLIEAAADILAGASKANSAILHTGFDAPVGSLEGQLVQAGYREYLEIHTAHNLPLLRTGALVCAWSEGEAAQLDAIVAQARLNNVPGVRLIGAMRARALVPSLSTRLVDAIEISGEYVIDPWSAPLAYLTQAVALGARLLFKAELLSGRFEDVWRLNTKVGQVRASAVVNAAGLYGDVVDARLGFTPEFTIKPRKGQFVVFDKAAARYVPRIILPVPNEITKGIVVCPTVFGNVLIGPTAEEQEDRTRATVETQTLVALTRRATEIIPALEDMPVTAVYAGLRPATETKDYRLACRPEQRAITLGGVRSTGLTAALGLAEHALRLHEQFTSTRLAAPQIVSQVCVPNLAESRPRDWQQQGCGEIICHCEMVTRREIEAALASAVPPGDFGGLRRRTRAGLGRCQGFYCNASLAAITNGHLSTPLAVPAEHG